MCGIVGIVGENLGNSDTIRRMVSMLRHRGPDAHGLWTSEQAQLGHTRLSILDLSDAGAQPMRRDGLALVYNGEVYNFLDLRQDLECDFRSRTDSEVVLESFREHGPDCLHQLRGMFAFGVWDENQRRLFLARDRFGIKPLYYRPLESGLAFCSELAPLLELGRPAIDHSALRDYLTYGYIPAPKTVWQGIFKLQPAHFLQWTRDGHSIHRYWQLEPSQDLEDREQIVARIRERLEVAVTESKVSDVPLGLFLSGGVDSAAVAAYCDGPLQAFTLGQRQRHRDESSNAQRLSEHLGLEHHLHAAESIGLAEALDHVVEAFGEPFGDSGALAVWLISRYASQHVKVVLSGEGGDELFCGYRWYGKAMSQRSSMLRSLLTRMTPPMTKLYRSSARRSLDGLERFASFVGTFVPSQVAALVGEALAADRDADSLWHYRAFWRPELPLRQRLQYVDVHSFLADRLLTKVDRASMAWSLEARPPLLDHRLAELAFSIAPETQWDAAAEKGKINLRRAIEDRLPPGYLDGPKKGFNLAIARWSRQQPEVFESARRRLQKNRIISSHKVWDLTNEQTWSLLVLDRWLREYQPDYSDS